MDCLIQRSPRIITISHCLHAFHIFNGVFQAVEEFISVRQPEVLVFATKREELADIYDLYLRREQEKIIGLGYQLEPVSKIDPHREYTLRRIKSSEWI